MLLRFCEMDLISSAINHYVGILIVHDIIHTVGYNVLPFIIILSILVFIHELGHYLVAKKNGVRIESFSIGFGPELFGWTDKANTRWKLSAIPLGGYVKMYSDLNAASQPDVQSLVNMSDEDKKFSLYHKTVWQRIAVSVAGPAANYLFAILILTGIYATMGQQQMTTLPKVGHIMENSAASKAGLEIHDQILSIDAKPISLFTDMQDIVRASPGKPLIMELKRGEDRQTITVTPEIKSSLNGNIGLLGISPDIEYQLLPLYKAPFAAVYDVIKISGVTLQSLGSMIFNRSADGLAGPIGIANLTSQAAQQGLMASLWLAAMLSISLGLLNLMPVPMLDGGHLLFYFIEAIRGRPVSDKTQEICYKIGFGLIMLLLIVSTANDLGRFEFIRLFYMKINNAMSAIFG